MATSPSDRTLPPMPPTAPIGGHLLPMRRDPLSFMLNNLHEYGDVVPLKFAHFNAFQVNHPDLIQDVLVKQARNFRKSPIYKVSVSDYLGNGLLISDGDYWKRQRKMMQPAFHTQRINAYAETMVHYTQQMLAEWQDGQQRDLAHEMMELTLFIVGKTLFDVDMRQRSAQIAESLEYMLEDVMQEAQAIVRLPEWIPTPRRMRKNRTIETLNEVVFGIINERRENFEDRGDLLSMLLAAESDDGERMTDQEVRDEALTIVLAGHETTANALTWTLYLLATHPQVEARLVEEIRDVLGDNPPTLADLPALPYTDQVLKEGMRLYPPAWSFGRQATTDVTLGDTLIRDREGVIISTYAVHRDPRWFPQPEHFDPTRFTPEREAELPRYAYFPFGGGPRICIGNNFAMMEAQLILASIVQQYHLTLPDGYTPQKEALLTLRPKNGMPVTLHKRD